MHFAKKTIDKINSTIESDQGASYRGWLSKVLPHIGDAYDTSTFPFRSHLGASLIGNKCARQIWYSWRWYKKPNFQGRLIRLFNRGHLEEGRLIAALLMIGCQIYQQDENGKQFRINDCGGHFSGSGDGVVVGLPDLEPNTPALLEFKTSNNKGFQKLIKSGVKAEKYVHYVQMNIYMYKMGIDAALYMCVNKDDDSIHAEIVQLDDNVAMQNIKRASSVIHAKTPPKKIHTSPAFFECKYCDYKYNCHGTEPAEPTCRSCQYAEPILGGNWECTLKNKELSKQEQLAGCDQRIEIK